ncbi:MAG: hypothetical protein OXI81_03165 [Paracoccaceae bacterium]|nr:hypothetical protein [Paracoccaceae bacterium]MDE2913020.1 hypothetical protein [Paracoccaceae bacterium]
MPPHDSDDSDPGGSIRSAIEFGVGTLGVSVVVVLGHSGCVGVMAMIDIHRDTPPDSRFLGPRLTIAKGVRDRSLARQATDEETSAPSPG